eukprot:TRINITY_DN1521_c0_g1_i27.p1 TRINITY_DN1521_c0_g1~~TRINITY_DN1521_c0_g1_i27.p1  ORF type:complete len:248 (-),score=32.79 TRINITY_DN1521_c0_g1_i27:857-1600(-)
MEEEKEAESSDLGVVTDILKGRCSNDKAEKWQTLGEAATVYRVKNSENQVAFVVKQYHKPKLEEGMEIYEWAPQQKELSEILSQNTSYFGGVLDVKSRERQDKDTQIEYVTTEVLVEYGSLDLLSYRKQAGIGQGKLLDTLYQSAIAVATAEAFGIFPCDVTPQKIFFKDGNLKFMNLELYTHMDSKRLLSLYRSRMALPLGGYTHSFYPPEIVNCELSEEKSPISEKKNRFLSLGNNNVSIYGQHD